MILVDANLLLYAAHPEARDHRAALGWLEATLAGMQRVAIPWPSILAFVRISANGRAFQRAVPVGDAWRQVSDWLESPNVWIPSPTERHRALLDGLIPLCGGGSDLIHDAHLATLAIEHGLTLCSTDGDFARFPGLRWANPLQPAR